MDRRLQQQGDDRCKNVTPPSKKKDFLMEQMVSPMMEMHQTK